MRGRVKRLIGTAAIATTLGVAGFAGFGAATGPEEASANGCVAWSEEFGCEATMQCLIVTETHGYCIVYWTRGPNQGGLDFLFF